MLIVTNKEPKVAQMNPRREAKILGALFVILGWIPINLTKNDAMKQIGLY